MKTEINEKQLIHALAAMKHLDIIRDADVKYFMASDGSRGTQKFYDSVMEAEITIRDMEKPTYDHSLRIREVHIDTAMAISLLAEEMIGKDEVEKHLSVNPLYGKFADLMIRS